MLHLGTRLTGVGVGAQSGLRGSFSATIAYDAVSGPLGNISIVDNAGPVSLVGGNLTGAAGSAGGAFDVTAASGSVHVSFDRAGLGDDFVQGQSTQTTLALTLSDGQSVASVTLGVTIQRVNTVPLAAAALPDLVLDHGAAMTPADLSVGFSDPGDILTFSATGLPDGLSLSPGGLLTGAPTVTGGPWTVTVAALDSAGQAATSGFDIRVDGIVAATTDPNVVSINPNGWSATYTSPTSFDPVAEPRHVVVGRAGFDAAGTPVTLTEPVALMTRVREAWPNQGSLTADEVALSEFIYSGDTIDGVPNTSTRAAPHPQAMWLNPDLECAKSETHVVRLAVAHAAARSGRPVAAVRFTATDQSGNTVGTTVSSMSVMQYTASGKSVPHFEGALDFSALAQGDLITVDATLYPWVGSAFTISADADVYPSPNLTVLKVLNDRTGAYGTVYAYVDGTGSAAPAVNADAGVAETAPFATIAAAAAAISAHNAAVHGRSNASGGIIRLLEGVHTHASFSSTAVGEIPLVVEAADPGLKATTVLQDAGSSTSNGCPDKLVLRNLTLRRQATGNAIFLDNAAVLGGDNMLVVEGCVWDDNGFGASWGAWLYRVGRFWNIDNAGDDCGQCVSFSSVFKTAISIGSAEGSIRTATYHAAGCRDLDGTFTSNAAVSNRPASVGDLLGWSHVAQSTNGVRCVSIADRAVGPRGAAVVGCVVEHYGGTTAQCFFISADSDTTAAENVTLLCNTAVGSRTNLLYQDAGTARVDKSMTQRFCVHEGRNTKSDVFAGQTALTGNWPVIYQVSHRANAAIAASANSDQPGIGSWLGEITALDDSNGTSAAPLEPDWADDRSFSGTATGNGDYTPGPAHQLPAIPLGLAPYPVDLAGRTIANDGSAVIGALQP
ncbi:MAG: putative Ig domain-containing protein [Pseudomonadota bacterium]